MLRLIDRYKSIIISYKITRFEQFEDNLRLRAEIFFINDSKLFVRETIISGQLRKYSYHWQDNNEQLIVRWDNAPDWDVTTFPHHKHIGESSIESSYERTLEQVLKYINRKI